MQQSSVGTTAVALSVHEAVAGGAWQQLSASVDSTDDCGWGQLAAASQQERALKPVCLHVYTVTPTAISDAISNAMNVSDIRTRSMSSVQSVSVSPIPEEKLPFTLRV